MNKRFDAFWLTARACVCAAPFVAAPAGAATLAPQTVDVTVGSQQTLASGHTLRRVAIGDPSVADVLILKGDKTGLLLVGKSPGTTSVMVWERGSEVASSYTVNVTTAASRVLLGPDTPSVRTLGNTALISGSTSTMEQHQRAVAAAQIEASQRAALGGGATGSNGASGGSGGSGAGSANGNDNAGSGGAQSTAIYDTSTVASRSVVQVDVRVVEFSRSVLKQAGLNILKQNNGFTFGSFAPSSLTSATYGSNPSFQSVSPLASAFNLVVNSATRGIAADLSLMENNNLARVLAEPTLVALSGQSASFLAGGEIPVPIPQSLGTTSIVYKQYGVGLTLTPTVLSPQRIALKVAPEASQLDFTNAVTISGISVPAITTRRADTTVELGDGESFVIGGLIDRETISNVSKVPFLGDIPILGAFFKQMNYQQNDKELLIVVTPHLVSPMAKGTVLPSMPGAQSTQENGPVWRSFVGGVAAAGDTAPGFSK